MPPPPRPCAPSANRPTSRTSTAWPACWPAPPHADGKFAIASTTRASKPAGTTQAPDHAPPLHRLQARFEQELPRHDNVPWGEVQARLAAHPAALAALQAMEASGGEPAFTWRDTATGQLCFCDCSAESPAGRRSLCYDREALDARKEHKPAGSATEQAAAMGIELLTEEQYRRLQQGGEFDLKTPSWIRTPDAVRVLGGALFCDRRYGQVFVYHNGALSYYAARGFRGLLRV
ncbi:MAG: DUF4256 domain-containing protein [Rubrivivax sp.]|nr:DUF4256 domain-containing protein [Rubrivivax sp.]